MYYRELPSQSPSYRGSHSDDILASEAPESINKEGLNPLRIGAVIPTDKIRVRTVVSTQGLNPLRIGAVIPTFSRNSPPKFLTTVSIPFVSGQSFRRDSG